MIEFTKKQIAKKTGLIFISRVSSRVIVLFSTQHALHNLVQSWTNRTCTGSTSTLNSCRYTRKVGIIFETWQKHVKQGLEVQISLAIENLTLLR